MPTTQLALGDDTEHAVPPTHEITGSIERLPSLVRGHCFACGARPGAPCAETCETNRAR
jgi:hypothetical protein